MTNAPIMPERARQIIEKVCGRHGFMPDEILGGDASRDAVAARLEVRAALRSVYCATDVAAWLGERAPYKRRDVVPITAFEAGTPRVFSLWRGLIERNVSSVENTGSMRAILDEVARSYRVSVDDILSQSRCRDLTVPRQHAMWLMCRQTRFSRVKIGKFLGGRDHTTVLHGERAHAARIAAEWSAMEAA